MLQKQTNQRSVQANQDHNPQTQDQSLTTLMGFPTISQALSSKYETQDHIFYNQMLKEQSLSGLQIVSFAQTEKGITTYLMDVHTIYISYQIAKRYSEFRELHDQIKFFFKGVKIAEFPKKSIFALTTHGIEERMLKLNRFLRVLLEKLYSSKIFQLLAFVEMDVIFKKRGLYNMVSSKSETVLSELSSRKGSRKNRFRPNSQTEKELIYYLEKLTKDSVDRNSAFQKLHRILFEQKLQLNAQMVQFILLGDTSEGFIGLIAVIGQADKSHVGCEKNFGLLNNLLSPEFCISSHLFQKQLGNVDLRTMASLNLDAHIIAEQSPCKLHAIQLLEYFLRQNINNQERWLSIVLNHDVMAQNAFLFWKQFVEMSKVILNSNEQVRSQASENVALGNTARFLTFKEESKSFGDDSTLGLSNMSDSVRYQTIFEKTYENDRFLCMKHSKGKSIQILLTLQHETNLPDLIFKQQSWNELFVSRTKIECAGDIYLNRYLWPQQYDMNYFTFLTRERLVIEDGEYHQITCENEDIRLVPIGEQDRQGSLQWIWNLQGTNLQINIQLFDNVAQSYFSPFLLDERSQLKDSLVSLVR